MRRSDVLHTITNLKGEEGHQWVVDTYNSIEPRPRGYKLQDKDPWCASTVSAVFHSLGYDDLAECSCTVMVSKAKELGLWVEDDAFIPQTGDVIMYDWQDNGSGDNQGNPDHVGIVVKVTDKKITVREGNKAKSVGNRTIDANGKFIRGYIVPPYEDDVEGDSQSLEQDVDNLTPVEEKPEEKPQTASERYIVGKTYTVSVRSALNVRRTPKGALVGYANLTADGKKHAFASGALKNGTRVTCLEVKAFSDSDIWIKIPSGWICAVDGDKTFVV